MKIAHYLPQSVVANEDIEDQRLTAVKILKKTGISKRHVVSGNETTLTMAQSAAKNLFKKYNIAPSSIDYLIYCTQTPTSTLPSDDFALQAALGLPEDTGTLQFNHGCTGFVYALSLAYALTESQQARRVLIVTSESYTRHLRAEDIGNRAIFGDGAAAVLVEKEAMPFTVLSSHFGADGSGAKHLCLKEMGGAKKLYMNGAEVFAFTIKKIPALVDALLKKAHLMQGDIDYYVFHQANDYMLEHIRIKLGIDSNKFISGKILSTGNTVSNTIPLVLEQLCDEGVLKSGQTIMLVGFGVGLSWAGLTLSLL